MSADGVARFEDPLTCPVCGRALAGASVVQSHVPDLETGLGEFSVIQCPDCHLGVTSPSVTDETLPALYEGRSTADFDVASTRLVEWLKNLVAERRVSFLLRKLGRRVGIACLDYGTGNGRYANAMMRVVREGRIIASDFNAAAPGSLDESINYIPLSQLENSYLTFDFILQRHVLEHVKHPLGMMEFIIKRLNPGGIAYIEVPNLRSGLTRWVGPKAPGYYVPRHVVHYTVPAFRRLFTLADISNSATCVVGQTEIPMMGNVLAAALGLPKSAMACKLLGIALHPVQLAVGSATRSRTCIYAIIQKT